MGTIVTQVIEGKIKDGKFVAGDVRFNNLDHLTDGTIASGKPDHYYGARPEQLDQRVRVALRGRIIPSKQSDLPMTPNFFLEAKGSNESLTVAEQQAFYHGALGARGMQDLQSYGEHDTVHDNNAYTITSIFHGGTLKLYITHPAKPGSHTEYYMNQLNTWGLSGNIEKFRDGVTAYRNARDWAKEKRDEFIEAANKRATEIYAAAASSKSSLDAKVSTLKT